MRILKGLFELALVITTVLAVDFLLGLVISFVMKIEGQH